MDFRETEEPTNSQAIEVSPWVQQFDQILDPLRDIHHHMILNQHALAACTEDPLYTYAHNTGVRMTVLKGVGNSKYSVSM